MTSGTNRTIIVKLGGSTLGEHDTALLDIAALSREGARVIVVHGGGAEITRWLDALQIASHFVDGLRVTDAAALRVVVAVLAGVVNKELVAELARHGVRAAGISGADGGILHAVVEKPALGLVGTIERVDTALLQVLIGGGFVPLVAPIAVEPASGQLLNVNADTAAGEIAAAIAGATLVFLTDVAGVLTRDGALIERILPEDAAELRRSGTLSGGMIPKVDACLRAASAGCSATIVDGRQTGALLQAVGGAATGTRVG